MTGHRTTSRAARAIAAAAGLVVLAGCAASTPDPAPIATHGPRGPLDALLDSAYGADPALPDAAAQWIAQQAQRENAIAACMKAEGFEYVPVVPDAAQVTVVTEGIDPESREYAEQYGFGLMNQPEQQLGAISWVPAGGARDPNYSLRAQMSPPERDAYDTALSGPVISREVDKQGNESVVRDGGCLHEAATGGRAVADDVRAFLASLPENGAFDELNLEWAACLREAGFERASPSALRAEMSQELSDEVIVDGTWDSAKAREFGEREVAVAVASWDCKAATDYEARFRVIRDELQQQWIDEHRAELDEWLDATAAK